MTCSGPLVFVVDVGVGGGGGGGGGSLFRRVCWRKGTGGKLHERLCRSC